MGLTEPGKIKKTVIPEKFCALPRIKFRIYRRYRPEFISPEQLLEVCSTIANGEPPPASWNWGVEEVKKFVQDVGFPEFKEAFSQNLIDGKSLILLEADKLPKINIKSYEKIKVITAAIRELYRIDQDEHNRSIDLPIRRPRTLYSYFKCGRTGPTSYSMQITPYLRKIKIIRDETTEDKRYYNLLNHWNRIPPYREWCPHVLIGNIRRINPMTGTTMRQNFCPKSSTYPLKDLCIYSLPCQKKNYTETF